MNKTLETKLKNLPRTSGVYFHKAQNGEILYVGKAAVLRNRVRQYFQDSRPKDTKTMALIAEIADVDWLETESEIDALFLESEMVKRYMPRYNVLLRDDKSQLYVRIDMNSQWPHVSFTRNPADDSASYYGPFYNGYLVRKALRYLRRVYPYYTKPDGKQTSKLDEHIGLSPNRAEGSEVYKKDLRKLISYIKGNRKKLVSELERDMKRAAKDQQFEKAAAYRNKLRAMQELQQRVMFGDREFMDISKDQALAQLSKLFGIESSLERIEGYDVSHHGGVSVVASMVVFTNGVSDRAKYRKFKARTDKNDDVLQIKDALWRRFSERNIKSWGLPDVVLIDGGKGQLGAAIEALEERSVAVPVISVAKVHEELIAHQTRSNINAAAIKAAAQTEAGIIIDSQADFITINLQPQRRKSSGHAKNLRGEASSNVYDDLVKLLQRIRDESHRFALSYHTILARKNQTKSQLEQIPGVGPATRKKLITKFGSLRGVMQAEEPDIARVIGPAKAAAVKQHLNS